jgi:hypothetical protein
MKSTIFWDIPPCSPLNVNRRFGGIDRIYYQGRISRARYQRESKWQAEFCLPFRLLSRWYIARLIRPWKWRYVSSNRRLTFNGLHGVISQNIVLLIKVFLNNNFCIQMKIILNIISDSWKRFKFYNWVSVSLIPECIIYRSVYIICFYKTIGLYVASCYNVSSY